MTEYRGYEINSGWNNELLNGYYWSTISGVPWFKDRGSGNCEAAEERAKRFIDKCLERGIRPEEFNER